MKTWSSEEAGHGQATKDRVLGLLTRLQHTFFQICTFQSTEGRGRVLKVGPPGLPVLAPPLSEQKALWALTGKGSGGLGPGCAGRSRIHSWHQARG